jgi:bifunctional enzyme CysN/CysC
VSYGDVLDTDIESYLVRHERKELLRFVAVGSVDDGKSTLIGRLLHDTQCVYEDHLEDARKNAKEGDIDFALITDGLAAEREQGITIDVAYRYFTTPSRKFIIADTPGHIQYTRNMATGASTANVAIILIDARLGVLQQSRRHAYIASLLGIPHLLVAVNKMDLVDYDEAPFLAIQKEFAAFASELNFKDVTFLPISALMGDNVVEQATSTPWYHGPSVLGFLETVDIQADWNRDQFRYPVQYVIRPHLDYRGFAGQIASGSVKVGDEVMVLPSGKLSRVEGIDIWEDSIDEAYAPMSVTLRLEDEIDISRGDMLVHAGTDVEPIRTFDADVVWLAERPLDPAKSYLIKHATRYVRAGMHDVSWKLDMDTLEQIKTPTLGLNEIGRVTITAHRPICFDPYLENRGTGAFIVIDSLTNNTVGAGMIVQAAEHKGHCDGASSGISSEERAERIGHEAKAVLFQGQTDVRLLYALERQLFDAGYLPVVVHAHGEEAQMEALNQSHLYLEAGLIPLIHLNELDTKDMLRVLDSSRVLVLTLDESSEEAEKVTIQGLGNREAAKACLDRIILNLPLRV